MLATLYTKTASNAVSTVVANDPFTGTQIEINPATKRVTTPFPLKNFTVNGYEAVTGLH
jgi:indole-3-glycerol phosphate synthase